MKINPKRFFPVLVSAFLIAGSLWAPAVSAAGKGYWNERGNGWRYFEDETRMVVNRFAHIDGHWYNFDQDGLMQTGWYNLPSSDIWYYFDKNGMAVIGNWAKVDGKWYYFDDAGYMVTGWKKIDETWYYFYDSGALKTGWLQRDGKWYYLTGDGVMKRGWLFSGGKWYYLQIDGSMAVNCTISVDGVEYSFDYNGVWWVSGETSEEEVTEISPEKPENSTDLDAEESEPEPEVALCEQMVRAQAEAVAMSCKKRPVPMEAVPGGYLQSTLCLDRELIEESAGRKNGTGSVLYLVIKAKSGKMGDLLTQINIARRTLVSEKSGLASKVWSQGDYLSLMILDNSCRDRDKELEIAAAAFDAKAKELLGLPADAEGDAQDASVSETASSEP